MAVVIGQIITETAAVPTPDAGAGSAQGRPADDDARVELIVRRATERVMEQLRREWDR